MCKSQKKFQKDSSSKSQSTAKYVQEEEQKESSDSDFAFQVRLDKPCPCNCATVEVQVRPTDTWLFAFAQREPVPLVGCFDAEIESISTGSRTIATFLLAKGTTKSQPLLSLDTCVELGLLLLTNATHEKERETASQACAPSTDPVVTKLTSE